MIEHVISEQSRGTKVLNAPEVGASNYATQVVISGTDIYVGKAEAGSSTSSAVWQVKKIDTASDIIITWADGNDRFDNLMTDPAALTYA